MKHKTLLLTIAVLLLIVNCSREKDCLICSDEGTSDYNIYMMDGARGQYVFVYNTAKQKIVDSVKTGGHWYDNIEVSPDERYLFMSWGLTDIFVWDLLTRKEIKHLGFGGTLEVSPDGRYLAVQAHYFRLVDISTLEVALLDSVTVKGGRFDMTGEQFIGIVGDSAVRIYHFGDSITVEEREIDFRSGGTYTLISPTFSYENLYGVIKPNPYDPSTVYRWDLSSGSERRVMYTSSGEAQICSANDGALTLVSDPWSPDGYDFIVPGNIYFIDSETGDIEKILPPMDQKYYFDQLVGPLNPGEIVVTPDNQLALVGSGSIGTPYFGIISIPDREYIKIDSLGLPNSDYGVPTSIACPKRVK